MKAYTHRPDMADMQGIRETRRQHYTKVIAALPQQLSKRNERWMQLAAEDAIDLACLASGFGDPADEVLGHFRKAAEHVAKAWEFGIVTSPTQFLMYLSVALIARNADLTATLAAAPRDRYADPEARAPEAACLLCAGMAKLALREPQAAAEFRGAERASSEMDRFQQRQVLDLISMGEAVVLMDQTLWDGSAASRDNSFAELYFHPDYRQYPEGLLDVRALGCASLAIGAGLAVRETAYLDTRIIVH
jgi:hypothetical protein